MEEQKEKIAEIDNKCKRIADLYSILSNSYTKDGVTITINDNSIKMSSDEVQALMKALEQLHLKLVKIVANMDNSCNK